MDIAMESSQDGSPVCRAGELHLHSLYAPEREAGRFLETSLGKDKPSCVILLGPCIDYLSPIIRGKYPGATVLRVQYSAFFRNRELARADATWYPDAGIPLEVFFNSSIDEDTLSGIAVLRWRSAALAFPAESEEAEKALRAALERLASSTATVKTFGRRWLANACRSFLLVERLALPEKNELPIVIAAAGPSLRDSLVDLAPFRDSFHLFAVSSALATCRAAMMEPDLVIATDGGNWSRFHLYPLAAKSCLYAAPLSALPSAALLGSIALLPLDQGGSIETELLAYLGGGLKLPPHGTVAGTALYLAAGLGSGPIIFAGLDLAARGDRDHSSPHGFDHISRDRSGRSDPIEGAAWRHRLSSGAPEREIEGWRVTRSLAAYAGALVSDARALGGRLFRLRPSPVALSGFHEIDSSGLKTLLKPRAGSKTVNSIRRNPPIAREIREAPSRRERSEFLENRFVAWRKLAMEKSSRLAQGIIPEDERVREMFRSIDLPDWAAARRAIVTGGQPEPASQALGLMTRVFFEELERSVLR